MKLARSQSSHTAFLSVLLFSLCGAAAGCGQPPDACPEGLRCPIPTGTGGAGGSTGSGGEGGQGGSGGWTSDECVPSKLGAAKPVAGECGVFVDASSGKDGNEGSPDAPLKSLSAAIDKADGKPIYVCAASQAAQAGAVIASDQDVFGGLDCGTWSYTGTQSPVSSVANVPALTLDGAIAVRLEDLAISAATATDAGAHSIGVLSLGASLNLARMTVRAADGADGAAGADGGEQEDVVAAMNGATGLGAGSAPTNAGGGTNSCAAQTLTGGFGGKGGDKDEAVNKDGGSGTGGDDRAGGVGGVGQPISGGWSCASGQGLGDGGSNGEPGSPGTGGTGLGTLSGEGLQGRDGEPGGPATAGKSGGGGGGSKANMTSYGAGGGGGGAGGCAGKSGGGGKAGGSSIALAAVGGSVSMQEVELFVGVGANGGAGGEGQFGQNGGASGPGGSNGATGLANGCSGGMGGQGGNGGNAGGGAGGHAIGLAHAGTTLTGTPSVHLDAAQVGDGGDGGNNGGEDGFAGEPGTLAELQELGG